MRRIAVINQKGGVGKTTTAVNLGAALAHRDKTVLLIDIDPQANLSVHLDIDIVRLELTVYQVLIGDVEWTTFGGDARELGGTLGRARRTVFVVPPHPDDPRVPIEAATGLPSERLRRLVVDLEESIAEAA